MVDPSATSKVAPSVDERIERAWPLLTLIQDSSLSRLRRILPIPPAPAVFDQFMIDVGAIREVRPCGMREGVSEQLGCLSGTARKRG